MRNPFKYIGFNSLREKRLIRKVEGGGGLDDLGDVEFTTSRYNKDTVRKMDRDGKTHIDENGKGMVDRINEREARERRMRGETSDTETVSAREFFNRISGGMRNWANRIIFRQVQRDERLREGARKHGRYLSIPDTVTSESGDIRADIGEERFDAMMEEVVHHIWRMPDFQTGVVSIVDAGARAHRFGADLIQAEGGLPPHHELLRSDSFTRGIVPGAYYDGHLLAIGSNVLGQYKQRKLSSEYNRFKRLPAKDKRIDNVDLKFRGSVRTEAQNQLGFSGERFNSVQWQTFRKPSAPGQPFVYMAHAPADKFDDAHVPEPGHEAFEGLVFVYEDQDDPTRASEVLYMDIDKMNRTIGLIQRSPYYMDLITKPGYFSGPQSALFEKLVKDFPENPLDFDDIGTDFYADRPEAGRLLKEMPNMMRIVNALMDADISTADLEWLRSRDIAGNPGERGPKVFALINAIKADGGVGSRFWRRAMSVYASEFKDNPPDPTKDWFDQFLNP